MRVIEGGALERNDTNLLRKKKQSRKMPPSTTKVSALIYRAKLHQCARQKAKKMALADFLGEAKYTRQCNMEN